MNYLIPCPAWGYDYPRREDAAYIVEKGALPKECKALAALQEKQSNNIAYANGVKIATAIPLVHIVVAIVKALFMAMVYYESTEAKDKEFAKEHLIRSIFDMLFGPLLAIVDVIVTFVELRLVDDIL